MNGDNVSDIKDKAKQLIREIKSLCSDPNAPIRRELMSDDQHADYHDKIVELESLCEMLGWVKSELESHKKAMEANVEKLNNHEYKVKTAEIKKTELDKKLVAKLRASIMFLAPLLSRVNEVKFPFPGGDIIGKRPIDIYLDGLDQFGVEIKYERDYYHLKKTYWLKD